MSRILITGATGFVGRHLCETLVARGEEVIAAVRREPPDDLLPAGIRCIEVGDIGPQTCWNTEWLESVDAVVHLAARVHVLRDAAGDPLAEFRRVNVAGTERLARAASAAGVRRFVFVSSVHAMCTSCDRRLDEQTRCTPETPYGQSKLEAEQTLRRIAAETGLDVVIVRPTPVYGPGHLGNLSRLLSAVRGGWPLPLGKIANRRSLVFVGNLVDALAACVDRPAAGGQTFLVSDGEDVSMPDLVRRAAAAFDRRPRLVPAPLGLLRLGGRLTGRSAAVARLLGSLAVNTRHIRTTLAWQPPHTLDEGLAATARWMQGEQ